MPSSRSRFCLFPRDKCIDTLPLSLSASKGIEDISCEYVVSFSFLSGSWFFPFFFLEPIAFSTDNSYPPTPNGFYMRSFFFSFPLLFIDSITFLSFIVLFLGEKRYAAVSRAGRNGRGRTHNV